MATDDAVTAAEAAAALPGWRVVLDQIHLTVDCGDFDTAVRFVNEVAALANEANHHPDVEVRYNRVHVAVTSHDVKSLSRRDIALGQRITQVVTDLGLTPQPHTLTTVEIGIDALDIPKIVPFWAAVLGYRIHEQDGEVDLVDPMGLGPSVWFQQMDAPRPQRNRLHLDVWVAADEAEHRLAAAFAAGGTLVRDTRAPSFWVLADHEGNEACICTWENRSAD
ncbi:VOC family protein [Kribbia dieselivorans]|uniref:VOC family protein n=1 Tax=Kribbia dieselivorans TaxID=331526 RepID=UPI0008390C83|nr:VOC family protein [Kribbia dieselivorans]